MSDDPRSEALSIINDLVSSARKVATLTRAIDRPASSDTPPAAPDEILARRQTQLAAQQAVRPDPKAASQSDVMAAILQRGGRKDG
jgi:hypothetical protein